MVYVNTFIAFCTLFYCRECFGGSIPYWIEPCNIQADDFRECLMRQAKQAIPYLTRGVPALDLEPLEPIHIGEQKIHFEGLHFTLSDAKLFGMSEAKLRDIDIDLMKQRALIHLHGDLKLVGQCKIDGSPSVYAFANAENCVAYLRDTDLKVKCKLRVRNGADNETHLEAYGLESEQDFGRVSFSLGEDKNPSGVAGIENVINSRWQDLVRKFAPPITNIIANKINYIFNRVHSKIPFEQLIIAGRPNTPTPNLYKQ